MARPYNLEDRQRSLRESLGVLTSDFDSYNVK